MVDVDWENDAEERTLDNLLKTLDNIDVNCDSCRNINDNGASCEAYPEGIPNEIFDGQVRHDKPVGGEKKRDGKPILYEQKRAEGE